jgi:beta-lactamase-like protein
MLAAAWPEVAPQLRAAASITLAAHLDKLDEEGLLPEGVERPALPRSAAAMGQP